MKSNGEIKQLLIDSFDFEKVHKCLVAVDWKWSVISGGYRVPNIAEMKDLVSKLFDELVCNYQISSVSIEGFRVYFDEEFGSKENDAIKLEFILTRSVVPIIEI